MIRYKDLLSDTICSPVTPPGHSGVAVIRVSGDRSYEILQKITSLQEKNIESHKSVLCSILSTQGETIDQALVTCFDKGRSFTGDQSFEIACHGSPLIVNLITNTLLECGCRSAEKGEFSFRAFYNGKLDLVQAESIHQLITTNNTQASDRFLSQLQGQLSHIFADLEDQLVTAISHLEASIDFVEEDIETDSYQSVISILENSKEKTDSLLASYNVGKSLQGTYKILILGKTNVGKSSLFNQMVKKERAIVTDIDGTTRDLVSDQVFVGNHSVEFIDSAGIRETSDVIETIGIQKGLDRVSEADLILYIVDVSSLDGNDLLSSFPQDKLLLVFNKSDKLSSIDEEVKIQNEFSTFHDLKVSEDTALFVSATTKKGVDELIHTIEERISSERKVGEETLITQARHHNHLIQLNKNIEAAISLLRDEMSPDLISQEIHLGLAEIQQLLGKQYDDEVLDKIFSSFCIGK